MPAQANKLSSTQHQVLQAMYAGGHLEYGMYGGITGLMYNAHSRFVMSVHNNTIKALLRRHYIRQDGRTLTISDDGCDAIGCVPLSELD